MKISTVIAKINAQNESHNEIMKELFKELNEAIELNTNKERHSLIKKISKYCNEPIEEIEKKILPKRKRQEANEKLEQLQALHKKQLPVYRAIEHEGKTYYYENTYLGIVIQDLDTNPEIVGYYDKGKIVFTNDDIISANNSPNKKQS